jgi:hypothetical protein
MAIQNTGKKNHSTLFVQVDADLGANRAASLPGGSPLANRGDRSLEQREHDIRIAAARARGVIVDDPAGHA